MYIHPFSRHLSLASFSQLNSSRLHLLTRLHVLPHIRVCTRVCMYERHTAGEVYVHHRGVYVHRGVAACAEADTGRPRCARQAHRERQSCGTEIRRRTSVCRNCSVSFLGAHVRQNPEEEASAERKNGSLPLFLFCLSR